MPPKRDARRGGRRGRGRGAGCNKPVEGQAEQQIPAAPVTHTDLATLAAHMEQRFMDLMVDMAQNQQTIVVPPAQVVLPVPTAPPTPVAPPTQESAVQQPHILPNQLSAEEKHLRDFRKFDP